MNQKYQVVDGMLLKRKSNLPAGLNITLLLMVILAAGILLQ